MTRPLADHEQKPHDRDHTSLRVAALERDFEDGEHKARPLDSVAGADVYVIYSLHGGPDQSANDKLCRLLLLIGALKELAPGR